jgi:thiamine-monophosphate kinase
LDFTPRLTEAAGLLRSGGLHAMIDISDGLAADLHHVLRASGVGAKLQADRIPIRDPLRTAHTADTADDPRTPLDHAISDGEDFELLAAVAPEAAARLLDKPPCETRLSDIGVVVQGHSAELLMTDGQVVILPPLGYEHQLD